MPCSDSSSSIAFKLDKDERFISFEYAKITCGREITAKTGVNTYFVGRTPQEILQSSFDELQRALRPENEEAQFIMYMEWDALRTAIAQYVGTADESIDMDRCRITSIEHTDEGVEVAEVILPPRELPKILPCSLADQK